ncbi:MAG TPA: caspase family protein [Acidimicrobiales bacterium]|nr:caspase family protein [Acidimicrobiales bacterium]
MSLVAACSGVGANLPTTAPAPPHAAGIAMPLPTTTAAPQAPPVPPPGDAPIAPAPEQFEGAPPARKPPPRQLTARTAKGPGTWAVIVGINDYPGVTHDLRSAVADAEDVDAALAGMGVPADHRLVLKDGQVTRKVLRSAAEWLAERAGPDAVAVFFFAGHVRKAGATTEAMVAADGGTVTDAELAGLLRGVQARRSWVAIAACYGGGFTEVLRPGVVLTGAAPADKEAYENLGFGRSYLVQYMVREAMIQGRAPGTVQEAFDYARRAIEHAYPHREPVQFDHAGGPLDLRPPGTARPAPAPQSSQEPPPGTTTTTATTPPRKGEPPSSTGGGGPTTTTTAPAQGACEALTRVVRCTSG